MQWKGVYEEEEGYNNSTNIRVKMKVILIRVFIDV